MKNFIILIFILLLSGCITDNSANISRMTTPAAKIETSLPHLERIDTTKVLFREIHIAKQFTEILTLYKDSTWFVQNINISQDTVFSVLIEQHSKFVKVGTFYLNGDFKKNWYCYQGKDSVLTQNIDLCK